MAHREVWTGRTEADGCARGAGRPGGAESGESAGRGRSAALHGSSRLQVQPERQCGGPRRERTCVGFSPRAPPLPAAERGGWERAAEV